VKSQSTNIMKNKIQKDMTKVILHVTTVAKKVIIKMNVELKKKISQLKISDTDKKTHTRNF